MRLISKAEGLQVSDFRAVLVTFQETASQLGEQKLDLDLVQHLQGLIEKSQGIFTKINLLAINIDQPSGYNSPDQSKVSGWRLWLRKHKDFDKLSTNLRSLRIDIATACTVITA